MTGSCSVKIVSKATHIYFKIFAQTFEASFEHMVCLRPVTERGSILKAESQLTHNWSRVISPTVDFETSANRRVQLHSFPPPCFTFHSPPHAPTTYIYSSLTTLATSHLLLIYHACSPSFSFHAHLLHATGRRPFCAQPHLLGPPVLINNHHHLLASSLHPRVTPFYRTFCNVLVHHNQLNSSLISRSLYYFP